MFSSSNTVVKVIYWGPMCLRLGTSGNQLAVQKSGLQASPLFPRPPTAVAIQSNTFQVLQDPYISSCNDAITLGIHNMGNIVLPGQLKCSCTVRSTPGSIGLQYNN